MAQTIKYFSTNHKAEKVTFEEALLKGLAPDKGLFMPESIPQLSKEEVDSFSDMEYHEIAYTIFSKFMPEISEADLRKMTKTAYDFDVPLENVYDRKYVMRLDQGPTASFKDFAGRMMGQWMQYFLKKHNRNLTILTATSGDTGSAMASAFYGLENIKVVILFPTDEVSDRQRKQMTTLHNNIQIIGIDGKFDDCQAMVKQAFADPELEYLNLSSSNSINIGRLLPQIVYYAYAYSRLRDKSKADDEVIFSVPSGNFGDMMGGVLGMHMGLPFKKFIIAVNDNDEFPKLIRTHEYHKIEPSKNSLSNAMNVGHPSNLARLIELYKGNMDEQGNIHKQPDYEALNQDFYTDSVNNDDTKATIKEVYDKYKVVLEPHGSVGWTCLNRYMVENGDDKGQLYVSLETAHPAKFPDSIVDLLGIDPELPESMKGLEDKIEQFDTIETTYESFKAYLKENY